MRRNLRYFSRYFSSNRYSIKPSSAKLRNQSRKIENVLEENSIQDKLFEEVENIFEYENDLTKIALSKPNLCSAFYIAQKIDLMMLYKAYFKTSSNRMMGNYLLVEEPDRNMCNYEEINGSAFLSSVGRKGIEIPNSYIVIFSYGSVVFFNMAKNEQEFYLENIQLFASNLVNPMSSRLEEEIQYKICSNIKNVGFLHNSKIVVRQLDIRNVSIVSNCIGVTVALDYFENKADEMMNAFSKLNDKLQNMGKFEKRTLYTLMGKQNNFLLEIVDHLSLMDRSEITWDSPEYDELWDSLRSEYELIQRFSKVEWRLNLIQRNARFFLEIVHHEKSIRLEWTIVILIAFEVGLSLFNMAS